MILYRSGTSTGALLAEDCPASIHASLLCRLRALEGLCPVDGIVVAAFANRRQRKRSLYQPSRSSQSIQLASEQELI